MSMLRKHWGPSAGRVESLTDVQLVIVTARGLHVVMPQKDRVSSLAKRITQSELRDRHERICAPMHVHYFLTTLPGSV